MTYKKLDKNKVLIADDQESNRICLSFLLEQEGWEVNQAQDGREALEKVLQWQPDLLILDNQMPELTGVEVYQHLQLQKINLAVVLISSDTEIETIASCCGIDYYLQKPFSITQFLTMINSVYEKFFN